MSKKKHQKLAQKCAICGKEPAYYSKIAGNYVCLHHAIAAVRKAMTTGAIMIGAAAIILFLLGLV